MPVTPSSRMFVQPASRGARARQPALQRERHEDRVGRSESQPHDTGDTDAL